MGSISGLFNIAKLSLQAQQSAMQVTGHNVANVNTPGYSRQDVIFSETPPTDGSPGQIGTGVRAVEVRRQYDQFIEVQIAQANQDFGSLEARKDALTRVELLFNDTQGLGLGQALDDFFLSLQDLSNNPTGTAERTMVIRRAETLSSRFNQTASELDRIQNDLDGRIVQEVSEVNRLAAQIADLNDKITQAEITGQNANDYRDMRGNLLNELSAKIDVAYFEDNSGQVTVFTGGGFNLVEGKTVQALSVGDTDGDGFNNVLFPTSSSVTTDITSKIQGGSLEGLIATRDVQIPGVQNQLDQLAFDFVNGINAQHRAGYGLDGTTENGLFTPLAGVPNAASLMTVSLTDINKVAAAATVGGLPGDNTNALALAELQNQLTVNGGSSTFHDYYSDIVQGIGSTLQQTERDYDAQDFTLQQMGAMRESVSGVSLDEEMANLMKFQRAFEASAKLITLADDMLKTVIDMVR
ncbi:MAG: flagellar hook-associated protein FlgK [Nitrospirae bacterium]|nr:flagellar hook-associated protein FlgK [Nitrospirota bacterium]